MSEYREHIDRPEAAERAARMLVGAYRTDPAVVAWADLDPDAMPTHEAVRVWRVLVESYRTAPGVRLDESEIAHRAAVDLAWVVDCEGIADETTVRHHTSIIRHHADRRRLIASLDAARRIAGTAPMNLTEAYEDGTAGEALQRAVAGIVATCEPPEASRPVTLAAACRAFADRSPPESGAWLPWPGPAEPSLPAGPVMHPASLRHAPWQPWRNLASIAGIGPESVAVLVGPTGRGKTAFALQVALAVASQGHRVLYASAELPADELVARSIAVRASGNIPWRAVLQAYGDENVRDAAADLAASTEGKCLHLWAPTGRTRNIDALQLVARQVQARFIVVDYLQRFIDDADDKRLAVMRASGQLRDMSREGAAVLALSSIGRPKYEAFSAVERLRALPADELVGSGKEAGELEYDATLVLAYTADPPEANRVERLAVVRVVKQRAGQSEGEAAFAFEAAAGRFRPLDPPDRAQVAGTPKRAATGTQLPRRGPSIHD